MSVSFFEAIFPDLKSEGDTQVCCPFPHETVDGTTYYESNPSAGVNIQKGVFHCFACGRSYSEISFCANYLNISYDLASKFLTHFHKAEHISTFDYAERSLENERPQKLLNRLYITQQVAKDLHIGYLGGGRDEFTIPITLYGYIIDQVTYRPGQLPKYLRKANSLSGIPCPYDLWKETDKKKITLICAGEKDMLIARSKGFNAISFTGGENNCPSLFLNDFKDRTVYIIYDNDDTGRQGSKKIAVAIKQHAKKVYNVDLSNVCKEKGEDLWDFFCKYGKTKQDLINILKDTPEFTEEEYIEAKKAVFPIISLSEAIQPKNLNRILRSYIQVTSTIDSTYSAPIVITATKVKTNDDDDATMNIGDTRSWYLNDNNYKELFYLIDSNLKEIAIDKYIRQELLRIPLKEKGIKISKNTCIPIHKGFVTEYVESYANDTPPEFLAYSLNKKLDNGKKYLATYRLIPHPQDGQKLIMVVKDVEEADDFLETFKITDDVKKSLQKFQVTDTVDKKLDELLDRVKGIVKGDYNKTLIEVIDLWYHSVLEFDVGSYKHLRGYIDGLIIGESRIGKSSTVAALQKVYGLGKTVSLAGASATTAGLIGGSNKVAGGAYQTKAGIIPQNNRGAIIFEELIKCRFDFIKELTDIRSSNKVRIARVNGSIELPAFVRMLTLTNPRPVNGIPKPISSYPNGISVLTDVIETPEDIARYDMIAIFGFTAPKQLDPFYEPPEPLPDIDYQNRIRWIWSRKSDQIYISKSVYQHTVLKANELNKQYSCFINIFGVEAWLKLMRIAIAIAGYLCSTNETYEQIVVENEHVDAAANLLVSLYDNSTFRLKEYVAEENSKNELTDDDLDVLESIWKKSPALIEYLSKNTQTTRANIQMMSGLNNDDFNRIIHKLTKQNLICMDKAFLYTTNKFSKGYQKMDRSVVINKEVVIKYD